MTISERDARRIGRSLWNHVLQTKEQPPQAPAYIVPMATLNGVWIDPALGPIDAWMKSEERWMPLITFAVYCDNCKGFTVSLS